MVAVTEWEVRQVCYDQHGHEYYHQRGNCHISRRATKTQMQAHIANIYVNDQEEDEAA